MGKTAFNTSQRQATELVATVKRRKEKKIMAEGTIKRLTDKGFGFIETADSDQDMFFHMSAVTGIEYDQLNEGQKVTFDVGAGPKGPRAENVQLA